MKKMKKNDQHHQHDVHSYVDRNARLLQSFQAEMPVASCWSCRLEEDRDYDVFEKMWMEFKERTKHNECCVQEIEMHENDDSW